MNAQCGQCGSPLPQQCSGCGAAMPAAFRFCGYCAAPLLLLCPGCGAEMPGGFRFCGQCGQALARLGDGASSTDTPLPVTKSQRPITPPAHPIVAPHPTPGQWSAADPDGSSPVVNHPAPMPSSSSPTPGHSMINDATASSSPPLAPSSSIIVGDTPIPCRETEAVAEFPARRRVAILFVDLCGSTAMADALDPEVAFGIVQEFLDGLTRVVGECGGYVVKTLGDGLMALFGAPVAYGDDPLRAGRAALRLQEWVSGFSRLKEKEIGLPMLVRVGINYGSVVTTSIASGGRANYDVLGDAVNVAQRMEASADPGSICVSEPFYRITRGFFEYEAHGHRQVKGKAEPLPVYCLSEERSDAAAPRAPLPIVGRQVELDTVRDAVRRLQREQGGLMVVTGPTGHGKSRFLAEAAQELATQGHRYLMDVAPEGGKETPLLLWRRWLLSLMPVTADQSYKDAVSAIGASLEHSISVAWSEWLAALAVDPRRLVGLDSETRDLVLRGALMNHWQQREPAALLVDEADHLDALSIDLLTELAADADAPLLVILAGREVPESLPENATIVRLDPLRSTAARELLERMIPEIEAAPELCEALAARSGGNPLFLEQMIQEATRSTDPIAALAAVPDTLYAMAQAQIDALPGRERQALQMASVLRKSFAERWMEALWPLAPGESPPWRALEGRGFLEEIAPPPDRELGFKHGAIQEVVYEGLLHAQSARAHAQVAAVITREAEIRSDHHLASRAAWHWRGAGDEKLALKWTLISAERAAWLHEGDEARGQYQEALDEAHRLDDPEAESRAEMGLGDLLGHAGDFSAALEKYEHALAKLDRLDSDLPDLRLLKMRILRRKGRSLALRGASASARSALDHALQLSDGAEAADLREEHVRCLTEQAHLLLDLGLPEDAANAARSAKQLAEEAGWEDEIAAAGAALGRVYPALGSWPAAERELAEAARRAEDCGQMQVASACWINLANGLQAVGRFDEAVAAYEQGLQWAAQIGDAEKAALIRANLGTLYLNRGDWSEAEQEFKAARDQFMSMGHHLGLTITYCNLGDTLRLAGRLDDARDAHRNAETHAQKVEAPFVHVHLLIVEAELGLAEENPAQAADLARQAVTLAREGHYDSGLNAARLTLGKALTQLGEYQAAAEELTAALEYFDLSEEILDAARARAHLAAALREPEERPRARSLHEEAVAAITHLGAVPWLEKLPTLEPAI